MSIRHTFTARLILLSGALSATPAFAQDSALRPIPSQLATTPRAVPSYSAQDRQNWLADCRARMSRSDDGLGGAVIGGLIGGIAGNRIAGRGNRTVGTVVGAGVGAVAGAAIDRAEDRSETRDFCEDYISRYEASFANAGATYAAAGTQYGAAGSPYYAGRVMWVPLTISSCGCDCKTEEPEVEEWVNEPALVPAQRTIPAERLKLEPIKY